MKIEAKIDRIFQKGNLKAIASVSLDGMFVVKGLKVMDGRKGLFVSMPQESFSGKDGQKQYSNIFFAMTNAAKTQLQDAVLDAYQLNLNPSYVPKQGREQQAYPQQVRQQQELCGGHRQQQYTNQNFQGQRFAEPKYPEFLGGSGDMLPMGIY